MKKELEHFYVGQDYGGNQDKLRGFVMRMGGCAAVTACDTCICLDHAFGTHLYNHSGSAMEAEQYEAYLLEMKPYLRPRMSGIDRLEIYEEGLMNFLRDRGEEGIIIEGYGGEHPVSAAKEKIKSQIDAGFPIPYLLLRHQDKALDDFIWHWFLLNGYEETEDRFLVKVTSYGEWLWMDLRHLWETGFERKGGMILLGNSGRSGRGMV